MSEDTPTLKFNKGKTLQEKLHEQACEALQDRYLDPESGYIVFTRLYHERRGYCCKSECRHCPWGYKKPVT